MKTFTLILFLLLTTMLCSQNNYVLASNISTEFNTTSLNYELHMYVPNDNAHITSNQFGLMNKRLPIANRSYGYGSELAVGLLISGAAFIIGGLTTQVPYDGYNGINKPFFRQGPRMYAIMGGCVLFSAGFVLTIPQ